MAEYDVVGKRKTIWMLKRNMIVMFVVVGLLAAAAIGMLLVTPILVRSNLPDIIGGDADDLLTGGKGAQRFVCGGGEDTITDYDESEGDGKTEDCENF
jgi:Ca2+-binding RTX toxin-like protein